MLRSYRDGLWNLFKSQYFQYDTSSNLNLDDISKNLDRILYLIRENYYE